MPTDPIIENLHKYRHELAEKLEYNLDRLFEYYKEREYHNPRLSGPALTPPNRPLQRTANTARSRRVRSR